MLSLAMITYTNIPYANSQLRGEWNSERGYLRIFNQDGRHACNQGLESDFQRNHLFAEGKQL